MDYRGEAKVKSITQMGTFFERHLQGWPRGNLEISSLLPEPNIDPFSKLHSYLGKMRDLFKITSLMKPDAGLIGQRYSSNNGMALGGNLQKQFCIQLLPIPLPPNPCFK